MQGLIQLIVYIIVFSIVAYGIWWVCVKFALPQAVLWLCGAVLLIILLLFAANQFTGAGVGLQGLRR